MKKMRPLRVLCVRRPADSFVVNVSPFGNLSFRVSSISGVLLDEAKDRRLRDWLTEALDENPEQGEEVV